MPRRQKPLDHPRRTILNPAAPSYRRVIRMEGQIGTHIDIIRFLSRYTTDYSTPVGCTFAQARDEYFAMIGELVAEFLDYDLDLAQEAKHTDDFIDLMVKEVVGRGRKEEERNASYHWPRILWFLKLQTILEDEKRSISEAIVEGWKWFVNVDGYPATYRNAGEVTRWWHANGAEQLKEEFLRNMTVNRERLEALVAGLQDTNMERLEFVEQEIVGCILEFRELGIALDVDHPAVTPPDSARRMPECPVCHVQLKKEEIGSMAEHRPVQTSCGHLFGYVCFRESFQRRGECPECGNLPIGPMYITSVDELLESCDRELKWLNARAKFQDAESPHSALEKLGLVLEPAEEIRRRLHYWEAHIGGLGLEWAGLKDNGAYLARERLAALIKGSAARYKEAVLMQMQVGARRQWLEFIERVLPE
jgi:hypothetical protein